MSFGSFSINTPLDWQTPQVRLLMIKYETNHRAQELVQTAGTGNVPILPEHGTAAGSMPPPHSEGFQYAWTQAQVSFDNNIEPYRLVLISCEDFRRRWPFH